MGYRLVSSKIPYLWDTGWFLVKSLIYGILVGVWKNPLIMGYKLVSGKIPYL